MAGMVSAIWKLRCFVTLSLKQNAVISCGGGIVVREENRALLGDNFTVYIKADVETLANRLQFDPNHDQRPSLTGKSIVDEIREVLKRGRPIFRLCQSCSGRFRFY